MVNIEIIKQKMQAALRQFGIGATLSSKDVVLGIDPKNRSKILRIDSIALAAQLGVDPKYVPEMLDIAPRHVLTELKIDIESGTDEKKVFLGSLLRDFFGQNKKDKGKVLTLDLFSTENYNFLEVLPDIFFEDLYKKQQIWETSLEVVQLKKIDIESSANLDDLSKWNGVSNDFTNKPNNSFDETADTLGDTSKDTFASQAIYTSFFKGESNDATVSPTKIFKLTRPDLKNYNYEKILESYKEVTTTVLEKNYRWRPALFGHHHHSRRVAVCKAIRSAMTVMQIYLILHNQYTLMKSDEATTPIDNALLGKEWSEKLKNVPTNNSGYKKAIALAMEKLNETAITPDSILREASSKRYENIPPEEAFDESATL